MHKSVQIGRWDSRRSSLLRLLQSLAQSTVIQPEPGQALLREDDNIESPCCIVSLWQWRGSNPQQSPHCRGGDTAAELQRAAHRRRAREGVRLMEWVKGAAGEGGRREGGSGGWIVGQSQIRVINWIGDMVWLHCSVCVPGSQLVFSLWEMHQSSKEKWISSYTVMDYRVDYILSCDLAFSWRLDLRCG